MVQVCVKQDEHNIIHEIIVHDHAGYAEKGQDLVCAGVSSITVGMMNALDKVNSSACTMQMKEAYIEIKVKQIADTTVQALLQAMLIQLSTMELTYHKFITISYQEV